MAVSVAFSTLLVLLSGSSHNLINLWNYGGGVNDPSGNKHVQELPEVMRGGSFRSVTADNFYMEAFDAVSIYGMNIFGDIFWETEFNVTGLAFEFEFWLLGHYIMSCSAATSTTQNAILNNQGYQLRLSPSTDTSWFAVSTGILSYGPLPLIFVPRSTYMPFSDPVFLDGPLGCWQFSDLLNVVLVLTDSEMYPAVCIDQCKDNATVAVILQGTKCYCADRNSGIEPVDHQSACYVTCPGSGSGEFCGGFSTDKGSAYHVQGSQLPGHVDTVQLYQTTSNDVNTTIQIDISDIFAISTTPAFITSIIINVTGSPVPTYTVWYNESTCLEAAGNMKVLTFTGMGSMEFQADGGVAKVDILRVRCIELILSEAVSYAMVELWGPDASSNHVEVPALVIRGKHFTEVTTTSTTSTSTSTTSAPTTTTSTSTSITTTSSTTSTTPPSTTTSTTTLSTTTSTSAPPTTTTTASTFTTASSTTSTTSATSSMSSPSTTTSAASSILTTTSPGTTTKSVCYCPCNVTLPQLNLTTAELQERIVEIQRRLSVNVSTLSSTIRKLTSAEDSRMSAVSIGYVGVGILVSIILSIVFIDSAVLFRDIKKLFNNIKNGLCPSRVDSKP